MIGDKLWWLTQKINQSSTIERVEQFGTHHYVTFSWKGWMNMKDSPPPSHSCLALCQLQLGVFRNGGKLNGFRISWALWLLVRSRNPGSLIVRTRLFGFKSRIPFFLAPYFPALFSSVSIILSALIMLSFLSLNRVLWFSYWGSGASVANSSC